MVTLIASVQRCIHGALRRGDIHCCKRDVVWHATRDQYEQCADEKTRVERNFSPDDVC